MVPQNEEPTSMLFSINRDGQELQPELQIRSPDKSRSSVIQNHENDLTAENRGGNNVPTYAEHMEKLKYLLIHDD